MLWNLEYDKKIKLHTHNDKIGNFLFCGKSYKYIISLDVSIRPTIILSDWTNLLTISRRKIAKKSNETLSMRALYIERKKSIIFVENFKEDIHSRIVCCEIKNDNLNILFIENMYELNNCLALHHFDHNMLISLVTIEKFCIKIWKVMQEKVLLENRIHSKEEISESYLNTQRNLLYFITSRNVLNVMNQEVHY